MAVPARHADSDRWRLGYAAMWAPPALLAFLVAFFVDAGEKQPLLVLAAAVLALPYLGAAIWAWRTWRSPLRALGAGILGAATAYAALLLYVTQTATG
jgi:hypothetical protein